MERTCLHQMILPNTFGIVFWLLAYASSLVQIPSLILRRNGKVVAALRHPSDVQVSRTKKLLRRRRSEFGSAGFSVLKTNRGSHRNMSGQLATIAISLQGYIKPSISIFAPIAFRDVSYAEETCNSTQEIYFHHQVRLSEEIAFKETVANGNIRALGISSRRVPPWTYLGCTRSRREICICWRSLRSRWGPAPGSSCEAYRKGSTSWARESP